jgi:hypothetical protein
MIGHRKLWLKIVKLAGLSADVTPHVLRHSFASLAADLGFSESTIAALIGHRLHSITSRYVHSADIVLLAAADAVASKIVEMMNGKAANDADDGAAMPNVAGWHDGCDCGQTILRNQNLGSSLFQVGRASSSLPAMR